MDLSSDDQINDFLDQYNITCKFKKNIELSMIPIDTLVYDVYKHLNILSFIRMCSVLNLQGRYLCSRIKIMCKKIEKFIDGINKLNKLGRSKLRLHGYVTLSDNCYSKNIKNVDLYDKIFRYFQVKRQISWRFNDITKSTYITHEINYKSPIIYTLEAIYILFFNNKQNVYKTTAKYSSKHIFQIVYDADIYSILTLYINDQYVQIGRECKKYIAEVISDLLK